MVAFLAIWASVSLLIPLIVGEAIAFGMASDDDLPEIARSSVAARRMPLSDAICAAPR
jgi:hypothetical protein